MCPQTGPALTLAAVSHPTSSKAPPEFFILFYFSSFFLCRISPAQRASKVRQLFFSLAREHCQASGEEREVGAVKNEERARFATPTTYVLIYIYICILVYTYIYLQTCVYTYANKEERGRLRRAAICVLIHVYIYILVYMYAYTCIYIYISYKGERGRLRRVTGALRACVAYVLKYALTSAAHAAGGDLLSTSYSLPLSLSLSLTLSQTYLLVTLSLSLSLSQEETYFCPFQSNMSLNTH